MRTVRLSLDAAVVIVVLLISLAFLLAAPGCTASIQRIHSPQHDRTPPIMTRGDCVPAGDGSKARLSNCSDDAQVCIAATATSPETCVSYRAFKAWMGQQ